MGVAGSDHGRFTKALAAGQLTAALIYAQDLPHVSLADALELCRLLARDRDDRFQRAASRWLERLSAEGGAGLRELQVGAEALAEIWLRPDDELAMRTLRAAMSRIADLPTALTTPRQCGCRRGAQTAVLCDGPGWT